jgi:hypothetical protein
MPDCQQSIVEDVLWAAGSKWWLYANQVGTNNLGVQGHCKYVKTGRRTTLAEEGCGSFSPEILVEAIAPEPDPRSELNEDDAPWKQTKIIWVLWGRPKWRALETHLSPEFRAKWTALWSCWWMFQMELEIINWIPPLPAASVRFDACRNDESTLHD